MAVYTLPDLPYDYGALDPHISGKIMELHHSKHHAAYVAGINQALEQLEEAREKSSFGTINLLEKNLAFHLVGHINHSIFWKNLSPEGGDKPTGELAAAIDQDFGSYDAFRAQFEATALGLQGSGWAILTWDTLGQRLVVVQLFDQQNIIPYTSNNQTSPTSSLTPPSSSPSAKPPNSPTSRRKTQYTSDAAPKPQQPAPKSPS